jgi:N-methylhydantoinase A
MSGIREEAVAVVRQGAKTGTLVETRLAFMRYVGQGHEIVVPLPNRDFQPDDGAVLLAAFEQHYSQLFSRAIPNADVEILSWTINVSTETVLPVRTVRDMRGEPAHPTARRSIYDPAQDRMIELPVYARAALQPGTTIPGPAIIAEDETTTFVSERFDAFINSGSYIVMERRADAPADAASSVSTSEEIPA